MMINQQLQQIEEIKDQGDRIDAYFKFILNAINKIPNGSIQLNSNDNIQ